MTNSKRLDRRYIYYYFSGGQRKAVVVKDTEAYVYKMQQQINEGDYEIAKGSENSPETCCSTEKRWD